MPDIERSDAQILRSWNRDLRRIAELEADVERLRADNERLKRFVGLTASKGRWPDAGDAPAGKRASDG
jgi:hypothetical protein